MKGMPFCSKNWKNSRFKAFSGASSFGLSFSGFVIDFRGFAFAFTIEFEFGFCFNSSSSGFVEVFLWKFFSVDGVVVFSLFRGFVVDFLI